MTSADVLADKSIRINLIIANDLRDRSQSIRVLDVSKIQLVSDSLERVSARGKLEGQYVIDQNQHIQLAAQDAIRASLTFPAFQEETKYVNLVFYLGSLDNMPDFQLKGIALFGK